MISIRDLIEKTTSQSEQQREVRQAERTNLSQMRDAAFEVVTTEPELYQKYLTLQADNIRCSAGNVALTLIQLPDASKIGSIDYWHSVGRYVQDEAMQNGAKVFVPPRNKNARGYFMGVYYDISQTTGRPLEGQAVIPEGSPKLIAALEPLMQGARAALKEDNTLEQSAYTTIQVEASGYKNRSRTVTAERTYPNLSDADVSLIPKTVEENGRTLTLANVSWQEAATDPMDGYEVPLRYTAAASYTGTASYKTATGYAVTVEYKGDVTKTSCDTVLYTAIFTSHGETHFENKTPLLAALGVLVFSGAGYAGYKGYQRYINKKRGYAA